MPEMEWVLFISQLPATPSSLRVNVWRRLRAAGAASLQNGVWIMPRDEANVLFLERLLGYIHQNEANGLIFTVAPLSAGIEKNILARFRADRDEEYAEFLERSLEFLAEIEKESAKQKFTFAELEEIEQVFHRLVEWLEKIQKRDFWGGEKAQQAAGTLEACRAGMDAFSSEVYNRHASQSSSDMDFMGQS